jgi:uncharacterized protein YcbK (DUF882 family)
VGDLSLHFSRYEFDSHDGALAKPDPALVIALEKLRARAGGRPLHIVSGYRSPAQNKRVRGARASQHLVNRAADIPSGYAHIEDAVAAGFTGIGWCGEWVVHVDVRPGKRTVFKDC